MGFLRLGSKKAKKDTGTLSPSFSSPEPLHLKLKDESPLLCSSPIADRYSGQQDTNGTTGRSLFEDIFSELNPSAAAAAAPEDRSVMRGSLETTHVGAEPCTPMGETRMRPAAPSPAPPPGATVSPPLIAAATVSVTRKARRRRVFQPHRSSVPDSDASDSDAASSSTSLTSESVGPARAPALNQSKSKVTPDVFMERMKERHRQECRKTWTPSPSPGNSKVAFYRTTASPSMPAMYPLNPMMLPVAQHESMQHTHHPGIVRSSSTFSGFYHPFDQYHPLSLHPLNTQALPARSVVPPMSPPLSPVSAAVPSSNIPHYQQPSSTTAIHDHPSSSPLVSRQPLTSIPVRHRPDKSSEAEDRDEPQSRQLSTQKVTTPVGSTTSLLVHRHVQTVDAYPNINDSEEKPIAGTPSENTHTPVGERPAVVGSGDGGNNGVRQVIPLGETMPVVLVSESETGTKQYYLLLPQKYGESLQKELQQRQQHNPCCATEKLSCRQPIKSIDDAAQEQQPSTGSNTPPCPQHQHRHRHHHHCSHRCAPHANHCTQHHRRHHHCCRRSGSGSSKVESTVSVAQRSRSAA